jgi:hypothetical protein
VSVVVYRQGPLVVARDEAGWSIVDGAGRARVGNDGTVVFEGDDDVVGVVALALSARLRGEAFHLHAGVVRVGGGDDDGVILVAGDGGAGKTTATLALASSGGLIGDDVSFVQVVDDVVAARAHRRPLHVGTETWAMFPALHILSDTPTRAGKLAATLPDAGNVDDDRDRPWPVRGLVFPRIDRRDGSATQVTALTPSTTLAHLLRASAMVTWPGLPHAQAHLDVLGRLARLPAVDLVMGQDARTRPTRIVEALRRTAPRFLA